MRVKKTFVSQIIINTFVACVLIGCASPTKRPHVWYWAGVDAIEEGLPQKASDFFSLSCEQGSAAACLQINKPVDQQQLQRLSILQGLTGPNKTEISIVVPKEKRVRILLWENGKNILKHPQQTNHEHIDESDWAVEKLFYRDLNPLTTYRLDIMTPSGDLLDTRLLKTLDINRNKTSVAIASCMDDSFESQDIMWKQLLSQNPSAIFMIGDNVYTDLKNKNVDQNILWNRYAETRNHLSVFKAPILVPIFAMWDDHDYGQDNGGRGFNLREESQYVFSTFFAQEGRETNYFKKGPGLAFSFNAFLQHFIFLDNRSFRSAKGDPDQTHFGQDQVNWLLTQLTTSNELNWLISGDQYFGAYHQFESYEGVHPKDFQNFLKKLKATKKQIVFISGDRHLAELMRIPKNILGYETYEITTSGIHAKHYVANWDTKPNPRQIAGVDLKDNYLLLQIETNDHKNKILGTIFGPNNEVLIKHEWMQ